MEFDDDRSNADQQNIQNILDDIELAEQSVSNCFAKRDNTFFIVDCSKQIMTPLAGQTQSQFDKIMQSYANFMMSKIIANCNDRVGLIFYNVDKKSNSLNFEHISTIHQLECPSAKMVKSVEKIRKQFVLTYGFAEQKVPLHQILWLFGQQIKDCDSYRNHVRLFLFTANDTPHSEIDQRRDQTINIARQLSVKGAQIQLFPIKKSVNAKFNIRNFYHQIISFDTEELNSNVLDSSSKIMDLQCRVRQKQFKKRTLNRLLMQIGDDSFIGVNIYALYSKARKPACKKLQATTNKPLKRVVKRLNTNGEVLYNEQIGTYYPLGGERVILSKQDMNKIKSIKKPGLTLIGFKPKKLIKPYHNLRPSYFLYPDEQHVSGSSQFFDALIDQLLETQQVAIVSLMPRMNQQLRFAALFPQKQMYDIQDHHQTPPGFNMIVLPYSDDIVNFAGGDKLNIKPTKVSIELIKLTKLLINNLTVSDFDFQSFQNPSLQHFYCYLQGHALNQTNPKPKKDTMQPDYEGFQKLSDIFKMTEETADAQIQEQIPQEVRRPKRNNDKKQEKRQKKEKKQQNYEYQEKKKPTRGSSKSKYNKEQTDYEKSEPQNRNKSRKQNVKKEQSQLLAKVKLLFQDGCAWQVSSDEMQEYLRINGLSIQGSRGRMADCIMEYISHMIQ